MLILRMNSAGLKQEGILQRAEMTQPLDLASSCHQVLVEVLGPLLYRWDEGSVEDEGRFWGFCSLRSLSFNIQWFS